MLGRSINRYRRTAWPQDLRFLSYGVVVALLAFVFKASAQTYPYQNAKLSVDQRLVDLLGRMTLEEKVAQMCQYVGVEHIKKSEKKRASNEQLKNDATAFYPNFSVADLEKRISEGKTGSFLHVLTTKEANYLQSLAQKSRLKIPLLIGIDAIHGNGMVKGCTVFPSPISISSSWDIDLQRQIAAATAVEMKATGSQWAFSPNLDITRDPRWGRTGETFGEDPYLVSLMGVATIEGLQQTGVAATAKHLIAGSQSVNGLNKAPSDISDRTLKEIFLPPYQAAVKAGVMSVMPAHNELNGVPCHAHTYLMEELLRKQWGFMGFYISDWMDIERMVNLHRTVIDDKDAIDAAVNAGIDMHMHGPNFFDHVLQLVKEGKLSEERVTQSARRILEVKFKVGLFENAFVKEDDQVVFSKSHQELAISAAQKSIVLLKNNGILPLVANKYKRILVTGPNANNQSALGDWSQEQPEENIITVYEGIKAAAPKDCEVVFLNSGKFIPELKDSLLNEVSAQAKNFDLIIAVVGDNSLRFEGNKRTAGENTDLDDITLPGLQEKFLKDLNASGKPVVAVLINGRPLAISWLDENLPAVVEAWEPGSFGGKAVADILFGKINPSGKLTVSLLRNVGQIGNYYNHRPSQYALKYIGKATGPLYPFGFGLSYTTFSYGDVSLSKSKISDNEEVTVSLTLSNTGKLAGDEIVQLYLNGSLSRVSKPVKELKAFKRVNLLPGESKKIDFILKPDAFKSYNMNLVEVTEPGEFTVMVGGSSADKDLKKIKITITAQHADRI